MEFVGFVFDNWYWIAAAYVIAFTLSVTVYVFNELGSYGYRFSVRHGFRFILADVYAAADDDGDSDSQCRANLDRAVSRQTGRRSIQRPDGVVRLGRHVPGGGSVQPAPETLAS